MTDFGTDISAHPDLDGAFSPISGRRVLAESVLRRLNTPRGGLWWAPEYGSDVRVGLDEGFRSGAAARLEQGLARQLADDDRVLAARVSVVLDDARALRITVSLLEASGPFDLVFALDSAGVAKLVTTP